jgi:acyl carrier protein
MTDAEVSALVTRCLYEVAPEIEGEKIEPDQSLADQFELDSMDLLNLVIAIHKATGLEIPEADMAHFSTLSGSVAYLQERLPA